MSWLWCSLLLLFQGIKYSLIALREIVTKISLTWLKLVLIIREHNYSPTSAVLKPFCLCIIAPVAWPMEFTHWGPQLFLFSAFSVPAVVDAVVTPPWANFPSSRRPSRDTWNSAINTEEQFITGSRFPLFHHIFVIEQVMEGAVPYFSESSPPPFVTFVFTLFVHCPVKHQLRKHGQLVNECGISPTLWTVAHLHWCLHTHSCLHDWGFN